MSTRSILVPRMEQIIGWIDDCPVHGGLCFGANLHVAQDRRERVVHEAAMESNRKMRGADFSLKLVSAGKRRRRKA